MSDETTANKEYSRKRKKSFLKNARKYAKKGCFGRGSNLDDNTYQSFVRSMETFRDGFENDGDKMSLVSNVFELTENKELDCSCNQVGCRAIEMFLPLASRTILKRFIDVFTSDLRRLCTDRFASHVLEALIAQSCRISLEVDDSTVPNIYFKEAFIKFSKFLLNNLEDCIWDTYANHVIRKCLENLVQLPQNGSEQKIKQKNKPIPEEYIEIVQEYGSRLILWPQFTDLCYSELSSGFLQILLKCIAVIDIKLLKKYLKKLLNEVFTKKLENTDLNIIPEAFLSKSVIMLLETSLELSPQKIFSQIYAFCFAGRLVKLSLNRNTSFSVQKLLLHCNEKVEFEAMLEELANGFEQIMQSGNTGVLLSLAQTCKRLSAKQGVFMQSLTKTFYCFESDDSTKYFVMCLCRFAKVNEVKKISNENLDKDKLNLHGTLILQVMLDFNKPIKIVESLLAMDQRDLMKLFCNSMGSHIVDSFVKAPFVGEKSREKLTRKLMGTYQELATSKYGSRSFEAIWSIANLKAKLQIMEELSHKNASWSNSQYGKIIANKVNLMVFKRNKENWKNTLDSSKTREKMFADILK